MARVIATPTGGGPMGPFEPKVLAALRSNLPNTYLVAHNFQLKQQGHSALEYDFIVIAPHAMFVVEAKEWYGRLTGDDTEWLINQKPRKCPMWLVDLKCKVLKNMLGPVGNQIWVDALLVHPDETTNVLGGSWARSAMHVSDLLQHLLDERRVAKRSDISPYHPQIEKTLQGAWGVRRRAARRRVGSYEIIETLAEDANSGEYLARRALLSEDESRYRVRTWRLDHSLGPADIERRKSIVCRPSEAVAKVGHHPNLLPVLQFDFVEDDNEFFEVTEWSDYGTLHGYLQNPERDRLTLRERFQIAEGVASALEAVHAHGVVHRNVSPESIVIAFDRTPRLTDFDRAYIATKHTVFEHTARKRNEAFVPPELADTTDYDFTAKSDMYSFGVLLYYLLAGTPPFPNPAAAEDAGGKPSKRLSTLVEGVDPSIDGLVESLLKVEDFNARPGASEVLAQLHRFAHGGSTAAPKSESQTPPQVPEQFEVGTIVDDVLRIDGMLGEGAFSKVYRVYHLDHQETYAMKVLSSAVEAEFLLNEYNAIGKHLPHHANIARVIWMARLAPPDRRPYILSSFVDGETLEPYCKGEKRLSWQDILNIGGALLDALAAMHPKTGELEAQRKAMQEKSSVSGEEYDEYSSLQQQVDEGILHRDIKPANILLELPSHRPKLIDFNIATKFADAKGRGGTPRYWAPDRGQPKWLPNMDLFSLGVVLYELVAHHHPFPDDNPESGMPVDPRVVRKDLNLSEELSAFLLKAVHPAGHDRFQTAVEMKEALLAVPSMHAPIELASPRKGMKYFGLTLMPGETGRPNYNPYVTRLLTLYSQASRSNAGTRGLDEIARLTYVRTSLDAKLAPHIADGKFRLVIVTGNAGDGKTAFLQQVEQHFAEKLHARIERLPTGNGCTWTHDGLSYETNYDGSQDEGNVESDDVLLRFFEPFEGDSLDEGLNGSRVRLIAINEGRLLDFLTHSTLHQFFSGLREFVLNALDAAEGLPNRALLVNLNLRSVAAGGVESLVEHQLNALTADELWAPCEECAHRQRCPLKFNADTFRDSVSGPAVRGRLRRLFEVVHLRRKAHVTMRDLRSALSWILLRDTSCHDVARLVKNDAPELLHLYYPEALADRGRVGRHGVDDRLVAMLREADPGRVNDPPLDRRLDRDPAAAVPWMTFDKRETGAVAILKDLTRDAPNYDDGPPMAEVLVKRRSLAERWRRWAYYERRDEAWRGMLPYRALGDLEGLLSRSPVPDQQGRTLQARLRDEVTEAISLSEGLRNAELLQRYLALRISRIKDPSIRSYRLFAKDSFEVTVPSYGRLADYLECAPDTLELKVRHEVGRARLRISLDLLEMLELIRAGYRPSPADLQGKFVNLLIFRNELMNLQFNRIVVTSDERELYEIAARPDAEVGIRLSLSKFTSDAKVGADAR